MGARLDGIRQDARRFGYARVIAYRIVRRVLAALRIELYLVRLTPVDPERQAPDWPDGIELRRLGKAELGAACADPRYDMGQDFVESALRRGDVAFGAFDRGKLVAYLWRTLTVAPHVNDIWVRVNRPYSYLYKGFTLPSHRGKRLTPGIALRSDPYFSQLGYTHRCTFIDVSNLASRYAAKSVGSRFLGIAGFRRHNDDCRFFRSPAVRRAGFEFFAGDPDDAAADSARQRGASPAP